MAKVDIKRKWTVIRENVTEYSIVPSAQAEATKEAILLGSFEVWGDAKRHAVKLINEDIGELQRSRSEVWYSKPPRKAPPSRIYVVHFRYGDLESGRTPDFKWFLTEKNAHAYIGRLQKQYSRKYASAETSNNDFEIEQYNEKEFQQYLESSGYRISDNGKELEIVEPVEKPKAAKVVRKKAEPKVKVNTPKKGPIAAKPK